MIYTENLIEINNQSTPKPRTSSLSTINENCSIDSGPESPSKRSQTSKKSTCGLNKYPIIKPSDSTATLLDENSNSSITSQPRQQSFGLKLILKRQSGDIYEIKNSTGAPSSPASNCSFDSLGAASNGERPKREAARKVKFIFSETESDESPIKKRPKISQNHAQIISMANRNLLISQQLKHQPPRALCNKRRLSKQEEYKEVLLPFDKHELIEKSDYLMHKLVNQEPKISLNHSIPFPIALVEDKTNIVHTKALLLIHLYQSYSSPCIICVLCKNFFSIGEFSKHFHISEDDLDEDDDTDIETDNEKYGFYTNLIERKKEKKLFELRKKSYKILPYCLNQNNELDENQLKIWKLFSERFTCFKQKRQLILQAQAAKLKEAQQKQIEKKLAKRKPNSNYRPKSRKENDELKNWDYIKTANEQLEKSFHLNKKRLECEKIVYLSKTGSRLSDNESTDVESDSGAGKTDNNKKYEILKKQVGKPRADEPDLSLSEEEEEKEGDEPMGEEKIETVGNVAERVVEMKKYEYFYARAPSPIEKHFNYYDNLSKEILFYMSNDSSIVTPQSLILYNIKNRFVEIKNIKLAESNHYKCLWLCLTLDLDVKKPKYLI